MHRIAPLPTFPIHKNQYRRTSAQPYLQKKNKRIQQIVGSFLYYGRAIDLTIIKTLNTLATQKSSPTEKTKKDVDKFLDYCTTHPHAKIRFFASEMILQIHSNAAYIIETKSRSTASGHYFLGNEVIPHKPIFLNGAIHPLCKVIGVSESEAEAELGSMFLNTQEAVKLRIELHELGHSQPPIPMYTNNYTATSIFHQTINQQCSREMNMRYFWTIIKQKDNTVDVQWHSGRENLGDYSSKHQPPNIRQNIRPKYLHMANHPRYLQRSLAPQLLQECTKTLAHSTLRTHVLPGPQRPNRTAAIKPTTLVLTEPRQLNPQPWS